MRLISHSVHRDFVEFFVGGDDEGFNVLHYKISEAEIRCNCKKKVCYHADFLYKYFEKMDILQIANLLESNAKGLPPEMSSLRLSRMMMNVLFNCQIMPKTRNEIYGWEGTLEDGTKARVIEYEPMRSYEVYIDKIAKSARQIVTVSENGYATSCSCGSSGLGTSCDHLDAYTKAVDFWTGEDEYRKRLSAREVTNVPPPALPPAKFYSTNQLSESELTQKLNVQISGIEKSKKAVDELRSKFSELIREQILDAAKSLEENLKDSVYSEAKGGVVKGPENNYMIIDDFSYIPPGTPIYVRNSDGKFVTADGQEIGVDFSSGVDVRKLNVRGVYKEEKPEEPKEPPKPKTRFENFEL